MANINLLRKLNNGGDLVRRFTACDIWSLPFALPSREKMHTDRNHVFHLMILVFPKYTTFLQSKISSFIPVFPSLVGVLFSLMILPLAGHILLDLN